MFEPVYYYLTYIMESNQSLFLISEQFLIYPICYRIFFKEITFLNTSQKFWSK